MELQPSLLCLFVAWFDGRTPTPANKSRQIVNKTAVPHLTPVQKHNASVTGQAMSLAYALTEENE